MRTAIAFLEQLGADAALRRMPPALLQRSMQAAGISQAIQDAISRSDAQHLRDLIGAPSIVCCMVHTPDDDDEKPQDDPDRQDDENGEQEKPTA